MFRCLKADDIVAENALADRDPNLRRKKSPIVRVRPGYVDEQLEAGLRTLVSHELRAEVEMVVLKHDQRLSRKRVGRGHDLVGEQFVDSDIAVAPGVPYFLRDIRRPRRVPEVVLEKPQEWVTDHVVILVVSLGGRYHEAEIEFSGIP